MALPVRPLSADVSAKNSAKNGATRSVEDGVKDGAKDDTKTSHAKVLFIGPGAVGASVGAWVAEHHGPVWMMGHRASQAALRANGITTYAFADPDSTRCTVPVATVDRLSDIPDADIVVLAVKNYSLEAVARQVRDELRDRPIVVSLANGIDNQRILPKLFSKVIYGVVCYNARRDAPGVVGYQRKGPLLIGTPDNGLGDELRLVQSILGQGCPTLIVDRLADVVHTKIVINLTNALDALLGRGSRPLANIAAYQHLLTQTLWEGVRVIRAAGCREYRIPGMPRFALLQLVAAVPGWLTRPVFKRELRAMQMSSMTQDVVLRGAYDTELESITGYVVQLAAEHGVPAPYNRAIYRLGREKFRPGFAPLRCEDVLAEVGREMHAA
jgi:2-dehydropantoate 2-reductase